ncbi:MAG: acylphosphatase [Pseudomonadota bacterium]
MSGSGATRFLIEGRVQGVGYRVWCRDQAARRGLSGFVRNLADGRVEAVFIGGHDAVDDMLVACREGPPGAKVSAIGLDAVNAPDIDGFVILNNA